MDFLHWRPTQPAPREYHTQCNVVEVQTLVKLNPNILVRDVERIYSSTVLLMSQTVEQYSIDVIYNSTVLLLSQSQSFGSRAGRFVEN